MEVSNLWVRTWDIVAKMPQLRKLSVEVNESEIARTEERGWCGGCGVGDV
jgi:hypothetical protein